MPTPRSRPGSSSGDSPLAAPADTDEALGALQVFLQDFLHLYNGDSQLPPFRGDDLGRYLTRQEIATEGVGVGGRGGTCLRAL